MSNLLRSLTLKNFKGFSNEVRIELRPVTLLFGANSAGKSSVLQALHYAHEILMGADLDADSTRHGGDVMELGGFQNLVHNRDLNESIQIGVRMSLGDSSMPDGGADDSDLEQDSPDIGLRSLTDRLNAFKRSVDYVELRLGVSWSQLRGEPIVSAYEVVMNDAWCARVSSSPDGRQTRLQINGSHPLFMTSHEDVGNLVTELDGLVGPEDVHFDYELPRMGEMREDGGPVSWLPDVLFDLHEQGIEPAGAGFVNWLRGMDGARPRRSSVRIRAPGATSAGSIRCAAEFESFFRWMLVGPADTLRKQLQQMRYVGPLRVLPSRDSSITKRASRGDWADGTAAWSSLGLGSSSFRERVSLWMEHSSRLNTGYGVAVRKTQEFEVDGPESGPGNRVGQQRIRVVLRDKSGLHFEPQDIGVGVSQVLPVVVAALDPRASIVSIEQPELHVHPAVQVGLGDLFIEGAMSEGLTFLVETHSEHLVMRIQRRLREQFTGEIPSGLPQFPPEDISFIFFSRDGAGSVVATQIGLTPEGKFDAPWPNGFFHERTLEVLPASARAKLQEARKGGGQ
jgi:hypothetical protein